MGKFVTIYPRDDGQAVRLAVALHDATAGLAGPRVPSDRPLRPDTRVHCRYGSFKESQVIHLLGQVRNPGGRLVPDLRWTGYTPPSWVGDPFPAAGVAADPPG